MNTVSKAPASLLGGRCFTRFAAVCPEAGRGSGLVQSHKLAGGRAKD